MLAGSCVSNLALEQVLLHVEAGESFDPREKSLKKGVLVQDEAECAFAVKIAHFFVESEQAHREVLERAPLSDLQVGGQLLVN